MKIQQERKLGLVLLVLLFQCSWNHRMANTELYDILGVHFSSTEEEIRTRYADLGRNKRVNHRMRRAFDVLSNRTKRLIYDSDGLQEVNQYEEYAKHNAVSRRYRRAKSIFVSLWVKVSEGGITGVMKKITFKRQTVCRFCRGTGAHEGKKTACSHCKGRGFVNRRMQTGMGMIMTMRTQCSPCGGTGEIAARKCTNCRGQGKISESKSLLIVVPKGTKHLQKLIFEGEGHASRESVPGDVIVTIKYREVPGWKRVANDLIHDMKISFKEAVLGFDREVTLIDGSKMQVTRKQVTNFGDQIVYPNSGAFYPKEDDEIFILNDDPQMTTWNNNKNLSRGNLIIKLKFDLPNQLTSKQMQVLKTIYK